MSDPAAADHIKVETKELAAGIYELKLEGSLDWSNFGRVETAIDEIFKKNVYKIVVNLREAKYISSAGFGCFISSLDVAMKHDGDIIFAATPAEIRDVFNILGLSKILRFADDEKQAIAHFGKK